MGRRGGRSGGSPFARTKTTSSSTTSNKPVPTSKPTSSSSTHNTTSSKPQQQSTMIQQPTSGGGGFMSSMFGSVVGSMAGSYIAHKLFSPSSAPETNAAIDKEFGQCSTPFKSFLECVENNPDNIGSCQWTYNTFYNCQNGKQ